MNLKEHGKIDRKTYCTICGVGKTVAHEELADMVNKELIDMVGKGRGVHYILRMKRTISGQLEKMDRKNLFQNIGAAKAMKGEIETFRSNLIRSLQGRSDEHESSLNFPEMMKY